MKIKSTSFSGSSRPEKLHRVSAGDTTKSRKLKVELAQGNRADDQIDLSDIPEVILSNNEPRGRFYRPIKRAVSIRLDADVLSALQAQRPYQSRINAILRNFVKIGIVAHAPMAGLNLATTVYQVDIRHQGYTWRLLLTRNTDEEIQSKLLAFAQQARQPIRMTAMQNAIRQELDQSCQV